MSDAGIISNFGQGSQQTTGRSGDMMIQGDGFFVTRSGNEMLYTRAGSFTFDANGPLVTPTGEPVQGWTADRTAWSTPPAKPDDIRMPLGSTHPAQGDHEDHAQGQPEQRRARTDDRATTPATDVTTIPVKVYDADRRDQDGRRE